MPNQLFITQKIMAEELMNMDYKLITDGTDTHVILIDLSNKIFQEKKAETILGKAGITVTKTWFHLILRVLLLQVG